MIKQQVIEKVLEKLEEDLKSYEKIRRNNLNSYINSPSAMQARYDSRKEELGYLALGIEKTFQAQKSALKYFQNLKNQKNSNQIVSSGNLVIVKNENGEQIIYFIVEYGGGIQVNDVFLISKDTPLAKSLLGKKLKDQYESGQETFEIIEIF